MLAGLDRVHRLRRIVNAVFILGAAFLKFRCGQSGLIVVGVADHSVLGQKLTVDKDLIVAKLDRFARQADNAFDVIDLIRNDLSRAVVFGMHFIARIFENDDVAALDLTLRQKRQRAAARRKNKLI